MDSTDIRAVLAPKGHVRAAINLGNAALAQRDEASGALSGVTVDLARSLAEELGVELETVLFNGAGKVTDAAGDAVWDVAFLAIDPKRAEVIAYSEPYVLIESTYAVPAESPIQGCDELDRPGVTLVVAQGSAYDLHLSKAIRQAELVRAPTPGESFDLYRQGGHTAVAGVRESLIKAFGDDPTVRILPDAFATIRQAMALPIASAAAVPFLNAFLSARKANGFVRRALDASGRTDLVVPMAAG
jgi:polar amino acid transport system substrate-binding protein